MHRYLPFLCKLLQDFSIQLHNSQIETCLQKITNGWPRLSSETVCLLIENDACFF